ncbi:hypothetical protein V496_08212 [Pseudogymnoascus sp. VKM F-4515 (FW-2607)]|nr:hypothetical protein V496_08212 [Pseudogymnoascus sp. VKM F-4515 (FW-2607)]KFY95527.1 hypothetical protein V498_03299 [Pseudogymnoascus sp. VKM F-4517 (FW-2822)]
MSQAPFPRASLITEGLLEERRQISEAPTDVGSTQSDFQHELAEIIRAIRPRSLALGIIFNEIPKTVADTRGDDTGPTPQNITSETELPKPSTSSDSGIQKASDDVPRLSKSDGWTTDITDETDEETLNWLEKELVKQNLDKDSSKSKEASVKRQKQAGWPIASHEEERSPQKLISSEPDDKVVVHQGFGLFPLPRSAALDDRRTSFPPLSNESYFLTTYGLDPNAQEKIPKRVVVDVNRGLYRSLVAPLEPTGADGGSHALDGNLSDPWSIRSTGPVTSSFHSNGAVAEYFVLNTAATESVVSSDNLEFCTKCEKRHIKQGPPVTLDERDTCRSMLPDWFPKERYEKPWEAFTDLINKHVRASQMLDGIEANPETKAAWNKEYHDPSTEWKEAGRFGGWWKCRIEDDESDIPSVEKNCRVCLRRKVENDKLPMKRVETLMEKKQSIEDWIDKHMKQEMVKDRAYVKARLETEGF